MNNYKLIKNILCCSTLINIGIIITGAVLVPLFPPIGVLLLVGGILLLLGTIPVLIDTVLNDNQSNQ